ncbi:MAG: ABC transporter permease [Thermoleophilia bacterium]|nr:ABC transporter permease [Thermoleophilia bacterium]
MLDTLASALGQGFLYCFMVLGVYITFRVLDFPDLTVDGSLTLGAAVCAVLIVNGMSPFLATLVGMVAGAGAGCATGVIYILLKSDAADTNYGPKLISGILTATALYTVNLRIMGRSNIPLLGEVTFFDRLGTILGVQMRGWALVTALLLITLAVKYLVDWLLHTEVGLSMRAIGDNEQMIRSLAVNTNRTRVIGLAVANALVALTGALVAQQQGYTDIGMSVGVLVAGLAGVILGEVIFGTRTVTWVLFSVIGGSLAYRILIALGLRVEWIKPTDLKLLTALFVMVALGAPALRKKMARA